jgi:hypothetical protein
MSNLPSWVMMDFDFEEAINGNSGANRPYEMHWELPVFDM